MIRIVVIVTGILIVLVGLATLDLLDFIIRPIIKLLVVISCKLIDFNRFIRKKVSSVLVTIKRCCNQLDLFDKLWKFKKYAELKLIWMKTKYVSCKQYYNNKFSKKNNIETKETSIERDLDITELSTTKTIDVEPILESAIEIVDTVKTVESNLDYTVKLDVEEINKIISKPSKCLNCNYHKNEHCPNFISCEYEKIGYCMLSNKCGFLHRKTCKDYGNEDCQVSSKLLFKDS